jgi:hypothetical protein
MCLLQLEKISSLQGAMIQLRSKGVKQESCKNHSVWRIFAATAGQIGPVLE